jgi:hypothetical protein
MRRWYESVYERRGESKMEPSELDRESSDLLSQVTDTTDNVAARFTKMSTPPAEVYAKTLYLAFFVRMTGIYGAFANLIRDGYGREAELLVRPLIETSADWLYIETDPEHLGERYMLYQTAAVIQFLRDHGHSDIASQQVTARGDPVLEFCNRYGYRKNRLPREWCKKDVWARAREGGWRYLERIYPGLNDLLHNSPSVLPNYLSVDGDGTLQLHNGLHFTGFEWTIGLVCGVVLGCLTKANDHFELDCEQMIQESASKWQLYTQGLQDAG